MDAINVTAWHTRCT